MIKLMEILSVVPIILWSFESVLTSSPELDLSLLYNGVALIQVNLASPARTATSFTSKATRNKSKQSERLDDEVENGRVVNGKG